MKYRVYQETNIINGKIYVGITGQGTEYRGSGKYLKRAQQKYGIEKFEQTTICEFDDIQSALQKEGEIVNQEFVDRADTYNLVVGGGYPPTGAGKDNSMYGKTGYKNKKSMACVVDGVEYGSLRDAAKVMAVTVMTIRHWVYTSHLYNSYRVGDPAKVYTGHGNTGKMVGNKNHRHSDNLSKDEIEYFANLKRIPVSVDGKQFKSLSEARKHLHIRHVTIVERVKSKDPKWTGWKFV